MQSYWLINWLTDRLIDLFIATMVELYDWLFRHVRHCSPSTAICWRLAQIDILTKCVPVLVRYYYIPLLCLTAELVLKFVDIYARYDQTLSILVYKKHSSVHTRCKPFIRATGENAIENTINSLRSSSIWYHLIIIIIIIIVIIQFT